MYNEKPKMPKKKIIEISILIGILIWIVLFLIDYVRYTDSKHPLLSIKITSKYSDGTVTEYYGLGYVYRLYNRTSIQREELVPIWVIRKNPAPIVDLPETHKDYNVPENRYKEDKYKGLLYYYEKSDFVGTYKCINTVKDCNKATAGWDEYDTINNDYFTKREPRKIEFVHNQFAFIDDSTEQDASYGAPNYKRTIYLVDIVNNEVIARYKDIKDSGYDDFLEVGIGDDNKYIVKDYESELWGVIKIDEDGDIEEVLPFEYKSISFDEDTKYYILNKDNVWYGYDLKKDEKVTKETNEIIYDIFTNNNKTTYYKVGKHRVIGDEEYTEFKAFRADGKEFINSTGNIGIVFQPTYIMIVNKENYIKFMDYSTEEKKRIPLQFHDFYEDELTNPCLRINKIKEKSMILTTYNSPELGSGSEEHYIDTYNWQ